MEETAVAAKDIPVLYRPHQVAAMTNEADAIDRMLSSPQNRARMEDPTAMARASRNIRKNLEKNAPHPYETPEEQDKAAKRCETLAAKIQEGMVSRIDMRRNPVGAVDQHIRWERANKGRIKEYKYIKLRLNAGSTERDIANIEKLRPEGTSSYTTEAQIAGHMAMSPLAKENWPLGEPKIDTAAKQAERAQTEREEEEKREAMLARLAKAREAKGTRVKETSPQEVKAE